MPQCGTLVLLYLSMCALSCCIAYIMLHKKERERERAGDYVRCGMWGGEPLSYMGRLPGRGEGRYKKK